MTVNFFKQRFSPSLVYFLILRNRWNDRIPQSRKTEDGQSRKLQAEETYDYGGNAAASAP